MAQIPITADVAEIIGEFAEKVENRSLLLDKFVFHKSWPIEQDERSRPIKWDDASRWSFMRIAHGSQFLLQADARKKDEGAGGRNIDPAKADRLRREAGVARKLAAVKWDDKEIADLRARHTRRFLTLFHQAFGDRQLVVIGQLEGRMAINLSDSLIQNAGLCLDRLFGLPFIPGSAVKGVCRHAALEGLKAAQSQDAKKHLFLKFRAIFGSSENDFNKKDGDLRAFEEWAPSQDEQTIKGGVDFLPAYPVNHAQITVDLTTVHYPDYYRSGKEEDLSQEKPRPNAFPVVETGARFAFCLTANRMTENPQEILAITKQWLTHALTVRGVGAKTASGYGWFSLPETAWAELEDAERKEREEIEARVRRRQDSLAAEAKLEQAKQEQAERTERNRQQAERLKGMSPEAIADETVSDWSDSVFAARIKAFDKSKGGPSEAERKAIIRACHGARKDRWLDYKMKATKGDAARIVGAMGALSRQLGLGKMP